MSALYKDKRHGYQLVYTVYFPDGTKKKIYRYFKAKTRAIQAQEDADRLEILSSAHKLSRDDVVWYLHHRYVDQAAAELLSGRHHSNLIKITWEDAKKEYLRYATREYSETAQNKVQYVLSAFYAWCKDKEIEPKDLNEEVIKDYLAARRKDKIQKSTLNKELLALRVIGDWLVKEGILEGNPARKVRLYGDLKERVPRILSQDELKRMMELLPKEKRLCRGYFEELILFYLCTGMRRREMLLMKVHEVDGRGNRLLAAQTKSSKERLIDLHPMLVEIIERVLKKNEARGYTDKDGYFFGGGTKTLLRDVCVTAAFTGFMRKNKFAPGTTLHALRHCFISYLLANGADLVWVMSQSGQTALKTIQRYMHLVPKKESQVTLLPFDSL